MSFYNSLKTKIEKKEAKVVVIGMGYVGLPLALELGKAQYKVYGYDVNEEKIKMLHNGQSYIQDVDTRELTNCLNEGYFFPTSDDNVLSEADIITICVPTPLTRNQEPDISYIESAVGKIRSNFSPGKLIVLESTTYPGTTEEVIMKQLNNLGYIVGEDYFLCFSPERVDPGNKKYNTQNTPKVIGGVTEQCNQLGIALYGNVIDKIVSVSSPRVAEMSKLLENTFRSINISFVNEMAILCDKLDIDIWEVISAAESKPFGYMPFYPGPGIGGHCIPLDPMYLSWKAKEQNFYSRFIELAQDINKNMPNYVIQRLILALNKMGKALSNSSILLLGMSYKPDIDDLRESPSLELYELLINYGARVFYNDPFASNFKQYNGEVATSIELNYQGMSEYDCIVLLTNHSQYDYNEIYKFSKLIFDTRNGFKNINDASKIVKLGGGN
ncbi:nucleotide sugar dehydrogenase [Paenibacillus sp. HJL G12]|uniref:Nucleotide sugar dehydrogenase n=1 Tax=Paenibacillus dendrobii TaxID=2691084 RepID=A0A7X3IPT1_9BACL|nr:nucleotide sugar dehydrogenase [Paenibacillus dendrobii]MWV46680.1 nucleotide sugar dehydrogenase [Paenibacillus dendrobii]